MDFCASQCTPNDRHVNRAEVPSLVVHATQRAELVCASRPLQYDAGSGPESVGIDAVDCLCTIETIAPTAITTLWARIASVSLG